ncbi:MAG: alpha/beta hydrolase [Anaerolineae bacterium]|nr:alpha/beta hydrolase [Anaerolineae bacterium]
MSKPVIERHSIQNLLAGVCVVGEGCPVLALHGWGGEIQSFWPVAERLAPKGYQVHLLDLPGFGKSDLPPEPWAVADYMRFVLAYLDANKLERVSILGHSFGGRISLMLAAKHPERVNKMVLAASAGLRTQPTLRHRILQIGARIIRQLLETLRLYAWRDRLQERFNRRFASEDYLTAGPLRDTFVRVINEDLTPIARQIQAPTVLIWGDQDTETPLWQGRRLEELIPDAGLIVFQGTGHFAYQQHIGDYIRIVDHFLSSES